MRRRLAIAAVLAVLASVVAAPAVAAPAEKVTICHGTNSVGNPFRVITISVKAWQDGIDRDHKDHHSPAGLGKGRARTGFVDAEFDGTRCVANGGGIQPPDAG